MAEIKTAISIVDGMTPAFKSMNNAMNIVMSSFEQLQRTSGKSVNTAALVKAREELGRMSATIDSVENDLKQAAAAQENLNNKAKAGSGIFGGLAGKVTGLVAAYAGWESVMGLLSATDTATGITSRLGLLTDSLAETKALQEQIRASANRTYSSYKDTADMVGKLGIQAGDAFANNQDILNFAEQINKHLAISGTSGAAAQGAMVQMTQAMSNGVLRGEELNSVMDGMPTVAKTIEKYFRQFGDNRGLKAIAEDGLITADVLKSALYSAADETNKKFAAMGVTFGEVWNVFKNHADKALTPVYQRLGAISNSQAFQNFAKAAGQAVGVLAAVLVESINLLSGLANFVINNWDLLAPIVWGVTAAVVAYNAALLISLAREKLSVIWKAAFALASGIKAASTWAEVRATLAATAAQWGLNAALLACPLFWIVAGIIAVIAVIYLAVAAINRFAGTSYSATGIIAGLFATLAAAIYNNIAFLWNNFASFAEFLYNVFTNPVYSVKALFVNLASNVLDTIIAITKGWDGFATSMANAIVGAVNIAIKAWNGLLDLLPDSVKSTLGLSKGGEVSKTSSITSTLTSAKDSLAGLLGDKPADYKSIPKMQMKSLGGAFDAGYKWGSDLGGTKDKAKVDELTNAVKPLGLGAADTLANAGLGNGATPAKETAKNTKAMADSLEGSEEDIKLLRDLAEREVINRFTTAEIKIDMQNNNSISSNMDIDGVINQLTDKVYNAMSIAAEGVHI